MIDPTHEVSITRQAELLGISRAAVYYAPRPIPEADLELQRRIDELHLEHPFAGSRTLKNLLVREGYMVGRYSHGCGRSRHQRWGLRSSPIPPRGVASVNLLEGPVAGERGAVHVPAD